jgi:thymidylate synthase (FAD)
MNNNKVELLGFYGSDEVVAQSAWTSTSRDITDAKRERIPNLLEMLWSNHHETPFEKVSVHFLVDTEIASHIHLLKHRMANINGESARYKELKEDKFYLPEDWIGIEFDDSKFNKFTKKFTSGYETWKQLLERYNELGNKLYHASLEQITPVLGRKRAKESARFFKTYNSQIQADVTFNMRSFANFIKLRNSEHAQLEIREIAQQMWNLVQTETKGKFDNVLKVIDDRIKFEEKCEKYKELIMSLE